MRIKKPNKKFKKALKEKSLSVYGLGKKLGVSPQAAEYIVKKKDIKADYERIEKMAEYVGLDIKDIIDD